LSSIAITPPNPSIAKGTTVQLTATGIFSDQTTENLTSQASWTSSDNTVAQVSNTPDPHGEVTGLKAGSASITATLNGIQGSTTLTVTTATLGSIVITPTDPSIANGTTVQLTATGVFSDGTTENLTDSVSWISAPAGTATVDPHGLVTGTSVGSATITATQEGVSGKNTVTVTAATLASLVITPTNPSLALGSTLQLTATGAFTDGSTQDFTSSAAWIGSPFATVSPTGLLTGIKVGTGLLQASVTVEGILRIATSFVTVTPAVLTSLVITPVNPSLALGTTLQLTATGTFSDGTTEDFTSSADWIGSPFATVSPTGLLTGIMVGHGLIQASVTVEGIKKIATSFVTVTPAVLTTIQITPAEPSVAKGATVQLTATGVFSDQSTQNLTESASWTSAPEGTATVDPHGLVTGTAVGSATITATQEGVSGVATVAVTPATLTSLAITPANPSLAVGTTLQLGAIGTFSDGTTEDLTSSAAWIGSPFASVSPTGLLTGIMAGLGLIQGSVTVEGIHKIATTVVTVTPAVLTAIAIAPMDPSIANGNSLPLTATGTFSDGSTQDLTHSASWTSPPGSVVTVDPTGLVTGTAEGSATVTATQEGVSGSTTVTVTAAVIKSLTLAPVSPCIAVGGTVQLIATGTFSDGSTQDLTNQCSWIGASAASVTQTGLVTGLHDGFASIQASVMIGESRPFAINTVAVGAACPPP
jgi:uncharacterized protein YjdB